MAGLGALGEHVHKEMLNGGFEGPCHLIRYALLFFDKVSKDFLVILLEFLKPNFS